MTIYFQTITRDGQSSKRQFQLYGETKEQAIESFSEEMLKKIANGNDYAYFENAEDLKESLPDYDFKGKGYYLLPESIAFGREEFYATDAKLENYRDDVYTYGIEEDEDGF